jgi:hypothetical protein
MIELLQKMYFFSFGLISGPLIGMDWFLLILSLFNPPIHHGKLFTVQTGHSLCFVTLLLGFLSGLVLGPYTTFLSLELILLIQARWLRFMLYGGIITGLNF